MQKLSEVNYELVDFSDPASLLEHAKKLEGHTFREVLDLGIYPKGHEPKEGYENVPRKGGMGNLVEERYFGYKANSDSLPDFPDAGVELKVTCFDAKKGGEIRAGERLVLGMIAFDESIEADFRKSHVWEKSNLILLIIYGRNREINNLDQKISYALLFTPPEEDLAIMEEDYQIIQRYIMEGRAHELSESMTRYLGACTKGSTAEKSMRDQHAYAPGVLARGRAWCYKVSYMNAVLNEYVLGNAGGESIIKDPSALRGQTFEDYVLGLLEPYIGLADSEIAERIGLEPADRNKSFWRMIAFRILGLDGERAIEFEKAGISARTVRVEERGKIKESFPLTTFEFMELASEDEWEESRLFEIFDQTRYFFVVFKMEGGAYRLKGGRFWSMPAADMNGPLRECWQTTRDMVREGVTFTKKYTKTGKLRVCNSLPGSSDNPVAHVRPHAGKAAYLLSDGTSIGNLKDAYQLPDGQWMTKQSFWLNNDYVYSFMNF